jgi:hypothetical protein
MRCGVAIGCSSHYGEEQGPRKSRNDRDVPIRRLPKGAADSRGWGVLILMGLGICGWYLDLLKL